MRSATLLLLMLLAAGCHLEAAAPDGPQAPPDVRAGVRQLRIVGTGFVTADGAPFRWHGITAFRLVEMLARGRTDDVAAYLDWAAAQELTVVRVLTMAKHLFQLSPEDGVGALPELLTMAAAKGLYVEVVALADTADMPVGIDAHVTAVGAIAARHPNALVEIANEPVHPTQDPRLHAPAEVARLARLVPEPVPVALGAAEGDRFADGDYATFHFSREREWEHVLALAKGAALLARWKKPLINDEPIGAAAEYSEGRRDNMPERFAAAAALTQLAGMGATFHYEGGLQTRRPEGREAACLEAWKQGLALTADVPRGGEFLSGPAVGKLGQFDGARTAFARLEGDQVAVLFVDPSPTLSVKWANGWTEVRRQSIPGAAIVLASKARP